MNQPRAGPEEVSKRLLDIKIAILVSHSLALREVSAQVFCPVWANSLLVR